MRLKGARPKSIATMLLEIGDGLAPLDIGQKLVQRGLHVDPHTLTLREAMLHRVYLEAALGDWRARDFVADREEGKPTPITPTAPADSPQVAGFTFHVASPPEPGNE